MKILYLVICLVMINMLCLQTQGSTNGFRYDARDGKCKNALGVEGLNQVNKNYFISQKDGECATFVGFGFLHPDDNPIFNGPFDGWNLKGADLNTLQSSGGWYCGVNFTNADLSGAKMDKLVGVYTCVDGKIDSHTVFSLQNDGTFGCALTSKNKIQCVR